MANDSTLIRLATAPDIPTLVELMREFHAESGYVLDEPKAGASFATLLSDPALGAVWIFEDDGAAAGYVVLTVRFSMEYGGRDGFIDDLYVRPEYRGRGIARAGLRKLFAECSRRGLLAVHAEVAGGDGPAQRLYRSFGMRPPTDGRETLTVELRERAGG